MKSLTQEFNLSAAAAHDAFPEKLQNLVVLSTGADTPVYVAPAVAEALSAKTEEVKGAVKRINDALVSQNAVGIAYPYFGIASVGTKMIGLLENPPGIFTDKYTPEMRALYVLDHEIGHHVVENGRGKGRHLGETAADTFASLRHIQRFGLDTDYFRYAGKAAMVVLGLSPIHYTAAAVERVLQVAHERDITKLSLQETAQLAAEIADANHLDDNKMFQIERAFAPVAQRYFKAYGKAQTITDKLFAKDKEAYTLFVRGTKEVMRKHRGDAEVIKAGKRFLNAPVVKAFMRAALKENKNIFAPAKPEPAPVTPPPSAQTPSAPA